MKANLVTNVAATRGGSAWPHRLAIALVATTFPLIWIGGLVTTYKAGMAVPDWPNTYGYNLFLYPLATWINGPWDLFIEHGHRLWGASVGMVAIALVVVVWRRDPRRWMRWLAVVALGAVVFQGALGGLRVVLDKVTLARIHGCFGPAFFAFVTALAVCESRGWRIWGGRGDLRPLPPPVARLAWATVVAAYLQLVLGSILRHVTAGMSPEAFRLAVMLHVAVAFLLAFDILWLAWRVFRVSAGALPTGARAWLVRPAAALAALVVVQWSLGVSTWVSKYGWPGWLADALGPQTTDGFTVLAAGRAQAWITTGHVAVGSLILATSVMLALRTARLGQKPVGLETEASRWRDTAA